MTDSLFEFSRCRVDLVSGQVVLDGHERRIEPRAWALLAHLIRHRHRVVTKQELLDTLWPTGSASAGALKQAVLKARAAIGDQGDPPLILTVPRVGYRFMLPPGEGESGSALTPERGTALTVAVLPFDNATGDPSLEWVELGLMSVVAHGLSSDRRLSLSGMNSLLTPRDRDWMSERSPMPDALQRATGAQRVVSGRVSRHGAGYRLALEVLGGDPTTPPVLDADTPAGLAAPALQALLGMLVTDKAATEGVGPPASDLLAVEAFARGLRASIEQKFTVAIKLFKVVLDIEPMHAGAQLELLRAQAAVGDSHCKTLARRLLAQARQQGDLLLAASVHQAIGRLHLNRDALQHADARLEKALRLAAGRQTRDWTAQTLLFRAAAQLDMKQFGPARRSLDLVGQLCSRSGNRILPLAALNMRAIMASVEGDLQHAVALSARVVPSARAVRAHRYLVDACNNIAHDLAALGRLADAVPYAEEAAATAMAIGDWRMTARLAPTLCLLHRLTAVRGASTQLLAMIAQPDGILLPDTVWTARGHAAACAGRDAEAAACFEKAVSGHRKTNSSVRVHWTLPWLIESLVRCGRLADAQAELERASAPPYTDDVVLTAHLLHGRALLAHAQGRPEDARALLDQLLHAPAAHPLWKAWASVSATWLNLDASPAKDAPARPGAFKQAAR